MFGKGQKKDSLSRWSQHVGRGDAVSNPGSALYDITKGCILHFFVFFLRFKVFQACFSLLEILI